MDGYGPPIEDLGSGAYGTVTLHRGSDGTLVAIKDTGESLDAPSSREIHCLQKLKGCPHIVTLLDVILKPLSTSIILPYMRSDLLKYIRNTGSNTATRLRHYPSVYRQMVLALHYLKLNSIIHLDIKPNNILVSYQDFDSPPSCVLADFGLSRQLECKRPLPLRDREVYTPNYRPPEVIVGNGFSFTADIWAMGVTLLEYLMGVLPFRDRILAGIFSMLNVPLPVTEQTLDLAVHNQLRDSIAVSRYVKGLTQSQEYNLKKMLEVNPYDRGLEAMDLLIIPQEKMPDITPTPLIDIVRFNYMSKWLVENCILQKKSIRATLCSLDLLSRYYSVNPFDQTTAGTVTIACTSLGTGMIDEYDISVTPTLRAAGTTEERVNQMKREVMISMNYMLYNCSLDSISQYIEDLPLKLKDKLNLITELIDILGQQGFTVRDLKYDEMLEIIKNEYA